ncbi:hypothetical protein [Exiguobacterium artemiae]|uniref:hypothetical protein n=1 Tax=Exiguobacterium artemiae TaxID=340145 RepID=UPI002965635A|nr:hypothetical protein [Exiguobacterium sibiricum]MDW2887052.1 hypothetical protein [Exiguobacterium sibiricum]
MTTSPFPILQTTRLILREVTSLDASSLLTYLADERVVKPMGLAKEAVLAVLKYGFTELRT